MTPNRVRELRVARGLSQEALAEHAALSRQSIFAIESGRSTPGVDAALRIARVLECRVEVLFDARPEETRVAAVPSAPNTEGRVWVAHLSGKWVSHAVDREEVAGSADGVATRGRGRRLDVELFTPLDTCRENVVLMGCASALGVLASRLNVSAGAGRFVWLRGGSTRALDALGREHVHAAGVHLTDARTGKANVPDVRRRIPNRNVTLVTVADWEAGLVVQRGNPKKIRGAKDAGDPSVRVALREPGSGARRLWEREARRAGLPAHREGARSLEVRGHDEVASAVAMGAADVGVATRDAALAHGLDFVALAEERYDLVVPTADLDEPRVSRLMDALTALPFRRELALLGYDVRHSGERVAEIHAA